MRKVYPPADLEGAIEEMKRALTAEKLANEAGVTSFLDEVERLLAT